MSVTISWHSVLLGANASVSSRETSTNPHWLIFSRCSTRHLHRSFSTVSFPRHLSTSLLSAQLSSLDWTSVDCSLLPTVLFYRLCPSLPFSWLPSSLQLWNFPSLFLAVSWKISRTSLSVGFTPKQTKGSFDWHTYTPTQLMPNIVSQKSIKVNKL